ncbi:hypothetical protein KCTCHS21_14820 [Cohnella abietis]|uniref:HTH araC/xylS-type domain-containing protein n=1 Tax=Cohnella abietis TaxID=2507935 RepID=A0A3T1D1V2_9BACL|nr:hypothetical protein KCTCHS21_14820 [Cohnella abietis]
MKDIAIGTLAGKFNKTPNYLNTLFHKRNGVTFVKYLTSTRLFMEHFKCYPSEIRERNG